MKNKTYLEIEERRLQNKLRKKADFANNAQKSRSYEGRRYLGKTAKGREIWATMRFNRQDMQIFLEVNGNINDLLDTNAILAPIRITQRLGNKKPNIHDYVRLNRKNAGGCVTPRTIEYIKKLMKAVEIKSSKSHVDGKCSALLFQYVTAIIFEGDTNEVEGHYRWHDAVEQWKIPSGEYFIIDSY